MAFASKKQNENPNSHLTARTNIISCEEKHVFLLWTKTRNCLKRCHFCKDFWCWNFTKTAEKGKQECFQWEAAAAALPWWGQRLSLQQPVAVPGLWLCLDISTCGDTARAGPKWVHDAPIPPLGSCRTSQTNWSGCQGGFCGLPDGYFTVAPHAAILKPAGISLDTPILQNLQACSCHVSCIAPPRPFLLLLSSPCHLLPQPCRCTHPVLVPPACIPSGAAEPVAIPGNRPEAWSRFGDIYQFLLTLTLFFCPFLFLDYFCVIAFQASLSFWIKILHFWLYFLYIQGGLFPLSFSWHLSNFIILSGLPSLWINVFYKCHESATNSPSYMARECIK